MKKIFFMGLIILVIAAACSPSQEQIDEIVKSAQETAAAGATPAATQDVDQIVQATFQALTQQAEQANQTNQPDQTNQTNNQPNQAPGLVSNGRTDGTGSISGNLSFPSEGIPPLYIVAFNISSGYYYWVGTAQNQTSYQIDFLSPGSYHVVAYTQGDQPFGGAYDQAVLCGLNQNCTDYSLVDVNVQAGFVTQNINPGDWYTGPENYPARPDFAPQQNTKNTGSITGKLSYPSEGIPSMYVVAYKASDTSQSYYVLTNQNDSTYQINDLPAGNYYVVAYPQSNPKGDYSAGYSQAVPCGLTAQCTDHSLIVVTVKAGQATQGADPKDWYAGPGVYPIFPGP